MMGVEIEFLLYSENAVRANRRVCHFKDLIHPVTIGEAL